MKNRILLKVLFLGFILIGLSNNLFAQACPTILVTGSNVTCYGESNGEATAEIITGGSGSYTYTWSNGTPGSGSSSTITNLSVGTYTVTVKDNVSGCSVVGAYVVNQPDPISITANVTDVNCFGDTTGAVDISVNGGNTPYSYSWTNSSSSVISTSQDIINLNAGTYTVEVQASTSSCSESVSYTIEQPTEELSTSAVISNVDCFGNSSGAIDVSVWGGTQPYAYSWDNGQNTQDLSSITTGNYTLTITDNKGCSRVDTYTITQPTPLTATMNSSDVLCNGDATGTVTISPTGGNSPYTFSWQNSSNVMVETSSSLFNVEADTYDATVTDDNGCTFTASETVSEPLLLELDAVVTDVSCNGGSDGEIDLIVSGGVAPYSYSWTNSVPNSVGNSQDLIGVVADNYSVVVTDTNGCVKTLSQEIRQPLVPISVTVEVEDVLCYGDNTGSINLTVNGGTPPYTYSWSNGETTEDISNILAGNYTFTILDANGCPFNGNATVNEPSQPLTVTNSITDVNCFGQSNGGIDLTVTGGTPGYTFKWSNSSYQLSTTSEDLVNYPADDYRYEVTDANGCKAIDTLTISEPPLLTSEISGVNILCKGGNNGSVDLTVNGGVSPYTYTWNNGAVSQNLVNLEAGVYEVLVVDYQGCETTNSIELTEPADSLKYEYEVQHVTCNDGFDGEIELTLSGGTLPYDIDWSSGDSTSIIEELTAGIYEFLVTDNNGCTVTDSIEIVQPDAVTLNEVITDVSCNGLSDGVIDISPTGGTAPYQYTWFNSDFALSAQTQDLVDFPADIYQLEIRDTNNCFYEMFLEIEEPEVIAIEYTFGTASCYGSSDASIIVDVTGGTPAYIFDWSNGATTQNLENIPAGVYELDLTDANGCKDSLEVEIVEPEPIEVTFETTEVSCKDQFDGTALASSTGGNGGYQYLWDDGTSIAFNEGLTNDWHYVEVIDILGCDKIDSVFIDINPIACIDPVNTFSPNEDNYNDTWVIDNVSLYPNIKMLIYNKWGNLIYQTNNGYTPWDGKIDGKTLPAGVYYYILELGNDENEVLKGNITLIK